MNLSTFPTDQSLLPLVFLELHEFPVEASGFREASSRAVQRPPHTVQGPAHVHVVARRPRRHVGSVQPRRHCSDRGKKHNIIMKGSWSVNINTWWTGLPLRTYTFTPGKTPVTHLEEFTFSLVCLYMILHLKLLQFSKPGCNSRINSWIFIRFRVYSYCPKEHTAYMHCLDIISYRWW